MLTDEEGPEGLTQFLLLEVRKLREQLRNSRMCERRLSQRCRMAEEERSRAEHKAQELRHDKLLLERSVCCSTDTKCVGGGLLLLFFK